MQQDLLPGVIAQPRDIVGAGRLAGAALCRGCPGTGANGSDARRGATRQSLARQRKPSGKPPAETFFVDITECGRADMIGQIAVKLDCLQQHPNNAPQRLKPQPDNAFGRVPRRRTRHDGVRLRSGARHGRWVNTSWLRGAKHPRGSRLWRPTPRSARRSAVSGGRGPWPAPSRSGPPCFDWGQSSTGSPLGTRRGGGGGSVRASWPVKA